MCVQPRGGRREIVELIILNNITQPLELWLTTALPVTYFPRLMPIICPVKSGVIDISRGDPHGRGAGPSYFHVSTCICTVANTSAAAKPAEEREIPPLDWVYLVGYRRSIASPIGPVSDRASASIVRRGFTWFSRLSRHRVIIGQIPVMTSSSWRCIRRHKTEPKR